ncbi:thiolase family protein [Agromyces cerinus]|uniref:Probable acetyl-CoA acetyltransferase n=1 Tax=Agromyces cerinus subsp. cerinus TaxID=232089 RepID=A0A1N6DX40_9MICO|nr:thiolase family protein [Agromyces cerinus]SIN75355.1 acetyl-CoA acetyltransferases [Agromyces cerinus subsp. cerinus]
MTTTSAEQNHAYILDAVRTPFGRFRGSLSHIRVDDLAAIPVRALAERNPAITHDGIDDVILGDANGAGEDNRNVARMAVLLAGLPVTTPASTVNRLCGSGAESIVLASRAIRAGEADLVIAGGVEGMSRAPHVLAPIDDRLPTRPELVPTTVGWRMVNPLFPAPWVASLGRSAELIAEELGIGRSAQDDWALRSHTLAATAWSEGFHDGGVVESVGLLRDECIRPDTSAAALAALSPAFSAGGSVTAGNSSPLSDGAAATLIVSGRRVAESGTKPLARILGSAVVGVDPARFALAPVDAVEKLLHRLGRTLDDIAVLEINEAFAAVVLACLHRLAPPATVQVNPNGGAIALGHPLGASAARALVDCAGAVRARGGGIGIMTACIGVGQGIAVAVEVDDE